MKSKEFILGTAQLGANYGVNNQQGKPSKEMSFSILDCAWQNKINTIDTADAYGDAQTIIGEYHQRTGNMFKVNTKFKVNSVPIALQIKKILVDLNIPRLNVCFYHNFQDFSNYPDLLNELIKLKRQGKFEKIGLSVYDNSELEMAVSNDNIDVIQLPFNLLDNMNERGTLLKKAKEKRKTIQIRSVYLQGLFFKDTAALPKKLAPLAKHLTTLRSIAHQNKISIEQLAIAYVMMQVQIDEIIIGVENQDQLIENIELLTRSYNPSVFKDVEKIKVVESELLYPKNWNL